MVARIGVILAAALIASATGCSSGGPSSGSTSPRITLTFDGKAIELANPARCFGADRSFIISTAVAKTGGAVDASLDTSPELTVQSVGITGVDGDARYFWEPTSTMGEAMTASKSGSTVTMRGRIHQTADAYVKKSIEITATNCTSAQNG